LLEIAAPRGADGCGLAGGRPSLAERRFPCVGSLRELPRSYATGHRDDGNCSGCDPNSARHRLAHAGGANAVKYAVLDK
jgi:hypothetical protein